MGQESDLRLTGLDGANPLAFMAALGVLDALSVRRHAEGFVSRLRWQPEGAWRPVVTTPFEANAGDRLIELLVEDLRSWDEEPALKLKYQKGGRKGARSDVHDLKPPPEVFRRFLLDLACHSGLGRRRSIDLAAAFATDVAVDGGGNTKPSALHFTAGQQEFLRMVDDLRGGVTADDLREALFGPWRYERPLPVLQWDATASRDYALRATNPSGDKKTGVPGADWLALVGLRFFRVAPVRTTIQTTACSGRWKTGRFRWPLWTGALDAGTVQTVLQLADLATLDGEQRRARGIGLVLESAIHRSAQGGYGGFSPASVV